ncbi:MAG: DNA/RNA non-specific endonuclease [Pseudomonadota bacterium]
MPGYDENFLKTPIPLPGFSLRLEGHVFRHDDLRDGVYRDYINYSLAMHKTYRSPIFAALNIDQAGLRNVSRSGWNVDTLIGNDFQLNNDYYRHNRWDRGHIARRASAAHGDDNREAKAASDSTMFYTNACLQFDSFNQDEWLDLENWVKDLQDDNDNKITVFSGPIYGEESLFVVPEHRSPAEVPAAFFKVVCFTNKQGDFEVRAFNVPQDEASMADWQGRNRVDRQTYQTTVAEIEHLTGLVFPEVIGQRNPLLYHDTASNRETGEALNVREFPENIPVDQPGDLVAAETPRPTILDEVEDVFIVGMLPNPKGADRGREWVSILNLKPEAVDLADWELTDNAGKARLSGKLQPGQAKRLQGGDLGTIKLSNRSDIVTLWDGEGRRIDRVRYSDGQVQAGRALFFGGRFRRSNAQGSREEVMDVRPRLAHRSPDGGPVTGGGAGD